MHGDGMPGIPPELMPLTSHMIMAKLYMSDARVSRPSLRTCRWALLRNLHCQQPTDGIRTVTTSGLTSGAQYATVPAQGQTHQH